MKVVIMFAASALSAVLVLPTISQAEGRGVYATVTAPAALDAQHRPA